VVRAAVAVLVLAALLASTAGALAAPPEGIPDAAVEATVVTHIDGDKFEVRVDGEQHVLNLIGTDAPEPDKGSYGECYAKEASARVAELLPLGSTVWLERDATDKDGKDRLLRFVWVEVAGKKPYLLNQRLIREGFGSFKDDGNNTYDARFRKAQDAAQQDKDGLWGECGEAHVTLKSAPPDMRLAGDSNQRQTVDVPNGHYVVSAKCDTKAINVSVYDRDGADVGWPIARSERSDDSSKALDIAADGEYVFDVACDGHWQVNLYHRGPARPTEEPAPPAVEPTATYAESYGISSGGGDCDPNYDPCIPNVPYDLDCGDIGYTVQVIGYDRHRLDRDKDGWGCEG
jgi:micrococcal nuclease